jgi:hypothetical protein
VLDNQYLELFYNEIYLSNENTKSRSAKIKVSKETLFAMGELLAYKLNETISPSKIFLPTGYREIERLGKLRINAFDLYETNLYVSSTYLKWLSVQERCDILRLLVLSNLAYVEMNYNDRVNCSPDVFLTQLASIDTKAELNKALSLYNIGLVSPLMYLRLGQELLEVAGLNKNLVFDHTILGMIFESYIKGSNASTSVAISYSSYKINPHGNEIDLFDPYRNLVCELTVSNKKLTRTGLDLFLNELPLIRILSSKDKDDFIRGIYRIPFPKLCMMFDIGDIYRLQPYMGMAKDANDIE